MAQFLLVTTLLSVAGLVTTAVFGFQASPAQASTHILLALVTVVLGLFSQSMTMFFFIGTGKELKEKSGGDSDVVQRTRSFKSKVFPAAMWAMTAIMVTFITGGGVGSGRTPRWLHDAFTLATIVLFLRAYVVQLKAMYENASLMERYLKEE